jgi:hypothetical protein
LNIRRGRRSRGDSTESKYTEKFRAVVNDSTSLSIYDSKGEKTLYIYRKDLAKNYEIDVEASEAPVLNKMLNDPDPYESSMADLKILEEEVFPVNLAIKKVFDGDLDLYSVKLAIGGSKTDYVTIEERDLIKYDVKPTLDGLKEFYNDNKASILGFLDCEYITEEGNVIYLDCGKKNLSNNITSIKLKILASMQQRGFFLQQEHKYYGLQLYVIIESKVTDDDKLFELLKELEIDWEVIFFRRNLAIHDWTWIECERNPDNLKSFLRAKYDNLNYFDINNLTRVIVNNNLPFNAADRMAALLYKMKNERVVQYQDENQRLYQAERDRKYLMEEERAKILNKINSLRRKQQLNPTEEMEVQIRELRSQKSQIERDQRKLLENFTRLQDKIQNPDDAYSISLKKAEIAASAKLACAYLGIQQEIDFDRDIPMSEIIKYEEELSNI